MNDRDPVEDAWTAAHLRRYLLKAAMRAIPVFAALAFLIIAVAPYVGRARDDFVRTVIFGTAAALAAYALGSLAIRNRRLKWKLAIVRAKRLDRGNQPRP